MKKYLWAYVRNDTGNLVWTKTGHPAVWRTRKAARAAKKCGIIIGNAKLKKFVTLFI